MFNYLDEKYSSAQYRQIYDISKFKLNNEEEREHHLTEQSNQMISAISLLSVAVIMAIIGFNNTIVNINIKLSSKIEFNILDLFLISLLLLVFSLLFLVFSQWKYKVQAPSDIKEIEEAILTDEQWKEYIKESYRLKQMIDLFSDWQVSYSNIIKKRIIFFTTAIVLVSIAILLIIIAIIAII